MLGYENALHSMTRGTASFTMALARYEQIATEPSQRDALGPLAR
jgi:translation elongation factor EF-G